MGPPTFHIAPVSNNWVREDLHEPEKVIQRQGQVQQDRSRDCSNVTTEGQNPTTTPTSTEEELEELEGK
jgi:hypothetical protein